MTIMEHSINAFERHVFNVQINCPAKDLVYYDTFPGCVKILGFKILTSRWISPIAMRYQYRYPKTKKARIRVKWKKNKRNYRSRNQHLVVLHHETQTIYVHPDHLERTGNSDNSKDSGIIGISGISGILGILESQRWMILLMFKGKLLPVFAGVTFSSVSGRGQGDWSTWRSNDVHPAVQIDGPDHTDRPQVFPHHSVYLIA